MSLDYAQAATGRLGRKDWRLLFYALLVEKFVDGVLPADAVQDILTMAFQKLQHVLGGGGRPELPS